MFTFPVRVICVHRRSSFEHMSSRTPQVVEPADEEVSELGTSGASVVTPCQQKLENIQSVWEFEKIERRGGPDSASKYWHCGWCQSSFKGGWNATKVMFHCARMGATENDVRSCSGLIPKDTLALFQGFRLRQINKKNLKRKKHDTHQSSVSENQKSLSIAFQQGRARHSAIASTGTTGNVIDMSGVDDGAVVVSNSTKLTTAIAEFVYCKGLSFSVVEGEEFQQILKLASLVPTSYRPPNRKLLSNELLDLSYQNRMSRQMAGLEVDADVYGLSLFGDGATVHGMPLMNILAAGVGEPCAVLSIVDCKFAFAFLDIF
jgi:hypothetical protein